MLRISGSELVFCPGGKVKGSVGTSGLGECCHLLATGEDTCFGEALLMWTGCEPALPQSHLSQWSGGKETQEEGSAELHWLLRTTCSRALQHFRCGLERGKRFFLEFQGFKKFFFFSVLYLPRRNQR